MADIIFTNNASSLLAASIDDLDTAIQVGSGDGPLFPSPSGGQYFVATLEDETGNIEIVQCTSRTGDILTVVRGFDNSTAQSFALTATRIELRLTAIVVEEFLQVNGDTLTGDIDANGNSIIDAILSGPLLSIQGGESVGTPMRGATGVSSNEFIVPVAPGRATVGGAVILATGDDIVAELDVAGLITLDSATVGVDMDQDGAYLRMRGALRIAFDGGGDYLEMLHDDTDFNFAFTNTEEVNWDTILNMSANIQLNDNELVRCILTDYGITHQSLTVTANAAEQDLELGNSAVVDLEDATGTLTFTITNPPASATYGEFNLKVLQGAAARLITWPASFDWPDATAPTLSTADNDVDIISGFTIDGGITWYVTFAQAFG